MTLIPTLETCKALDWKKPTLFQCGGIEEIQAPTFAEIWAELPEEIEVNHIVYTLEMTKNILCYFNSDLNSVYFHTYISNIAEDAAQLFLTLKQNGFIK